MNKILRSIKDELDRGSERDRPILLALEAVLQSCMDNERRLEEHEIRYTHECRGE